MEDSNILYYLVLGAIYLVSRFLKKKKKNPEPVIEESPEYETVSETTTKKTSSFEDLFKELTGEDFTEEKNESKAIPDPEPIVQPEIVPTYADYSKVLDEVASEEIDIGSTKEPIDLSPKPKKSTEEESHEVHDLFSNEDDIRRAIILKEVLDRRY